MGREQEDPWTHTASRPPSGHGVSQQGGTEVDRTTRDKRGTASRLTRRKCSVLTETSAGQGTTGATSHVPTSGPQGSPPESPLPTPARPLALTGLPAPSNYVLNSLPDLRLQTLSTHPPTSHARVPTSVPVPKLQDPLPDSPLPARACTQHSLLDHRAGAWTWAPWHRPVPRKHPASNPPSPESSRAAR